MPRDSSGNYSLPSGNPVTSGTEILAAWANTTMGDLRAEMQDSLSRSGSGSMLAPLKALSGAANAPGITFSNEPSTGFYLESSGKPHMVVGGQEIWRVSGGEFQLYDATVPAWVSILTTGTPKASTTAAGIVELATSAETTTGTDATRATTPAGVKAAIDARVASTSAKGIVELADNTETTTGTDATRATTPASVKAAIDARVASTSAKGIVELADNTETTTGTDATRATTPAGVKAALDARGATTTQTGLVEFATMGETASGTANKVLEASAYQAYWDTLKGATSFTLPNGIIVQWGTQTLASDEDNRTVTLSKNLGSTSYVVLLGQAQEAGDISGNDVAYIRNRTTSSFVLSLDRTGSGGGNLQIFWCAIGV